MASLTFDYLRAGEDGTAQENLEMMAELIANGVAEKGLTEEALRHLMKIIAGLSYDEMRALASFIRAQQHHLGGVEVSSADRFEIYAAIYNTAWRELATPGDTSPPDDVYGTMAALQRTGLVVGSSGFGGIVFHPTPLLAQLAGLVDAGFFPTAR